jgi:hypothetical protein
MEMQTTYSHREGRRLLITTARVLSWVASLFWATSFFTQTVFAQTNDVQCQLKVTSQWDTGGQLELTVTNNSTKSLSAWHLQLEYPSARNASVIDSWGADRVGDNPALFNPPKWEGKLAPGASYRFGAVTQTPKGFTKPKITACGKGKKPVVEVLDADKDGVTDAVDSCPNTVETPVDAAGCSQSQRDDDRDGVANGSDKCPDTPANAVVDTNGCSADQRDDDKDGVANLLDACPDTPAGTAVNEKGCALDQLDTDKDGVNDSLDKCPGTSRGNTVDQNGCDVFQRDSDKDGVIDFLDQCPFTPAEFVAFNVVDILGCVIFREFEDQDGDRVLNINDKCPDTVLGDAVDTQGCSLAQRTRDSDFDGVPDLVDACPFSTPGEVVDAAGCPLFDIEILSVLPVEIIEGNSFVSIPASQFSLSKPIPGDAFFTIDTAQFPNASVFSNSPFQLDFFLFDSSPEVTIPVFISNFRGQRSNTILVPVRRIPNLDPDGDGLSTEEEITLGTNPFSSDTDFDSLSDGDEVRIHRTNPLLFDTDGGGASDSQEIFFDRTNPLDASDDIVQVAFPITLVDSAGMRWDVQQNGAVDDGTSDAFDVAFFSTTGAQFGPVGFAFSSPPRRDATTGEWVLTGSQQFVNLERRVLVNSDVPGIRYIDTLVNTSDQVQRFVFSVNGNLGSDASTSILETSSGDLVFDAQDSFSVSTDGSLGNGDPIVTLIPQGTNPRDLPKRVSSAEMFQDNFTWSYNITLRPGESISLMTRALQSSTPELAKQHRFEVENAFSGLSAARLLALKNVFPALDTDGDKVPDALEQLLGTDPALPDSDGDGRLDFEQLSTSDNPNLLSDTDSDGVLDFADRCNGSLVVEFPGSFASSSSSFNFSSSSFGSAMQNSSVSFQGSAGAGFSSNPSSFGFSGPSSVGFIPSSAGLVIGSASSIDNGNDPSSIDVVSSGSERAFLSSTASFSSGASIGSAPSSATGTLGPVDAEGCPIPPECVTDPLSCSGPDQDEDGVIDGVDLCPDTPFGQAVDATGCTPPVPQIISTTPIRVKGELGTVVTTQITLSNIQTERPLSPDARLNVPNVFFPILSARSLSDSVIELDVLMVDFVLSQDVVVSVTDRGFDSNFVPLNLSFELGLQAQAPTSVIIHSAAPIDASGITLTTAFNQLAGSDNPNAGGDLFRQLWDAQRTQSAIGSPINCKPINGFPLVCDRAESEVALLSDSGVQLEMDSYRTLAFVNRIELRDGWQDCGEHRVVFGRDQFSGAPLGFGRNFIILEGRVANPTPGDIRGCEPIIRAWESMPTLDPIAQGALLQQIFVGTGLTGMAPVLSTKHFMAGAGQIRTNQFITPDWVLREYDLAEECSSSSDCNVVAMPVRVNENPFGELFNPRVAQGSSPLAEKAAEFQSLFANNLHPLLKDDIIMLSNPVPDKFNHGQSHASFPNGVENDFNGHFGGDVNSFFGQVMQAELSSKVDALGNPLTVEQVLNRATAMTCGGCHQPTSFGLTLPNSIGAMRLSDGSIIDSWPDTLRFVHIDEDRRLSPALRDVFIPARVKAFAAVLDELNAAKATGMIDPENVSEGPRINTIEN